MFFLWYIFNIFVDDKDDDDMALEWANLENFCDSYVHLESSYFNL